MMGEQVDMNIVYLSLEYPPYIMGGAGVYISRLVPEMAKMGHKVHVITSGTSSTLEQSTVDGVSVYRLPTFKLASGKYGNRTFGFWAQLPWRFRDLQKVIGDFDIVHGNGLSELTLPKKQGKQPRFITIHHLSQSQVQAVKPSFVDRIANPGSDIGLLPLFESGVIRRSDHIIAVSNFTKQEMVEKLHISSSRISVIYHGANPEEYYFPEVEIETLRARIGAAVSRLLLFVGRLERRKGIDVLLSAVSTLSDIPDLKVVLAGSGPVQEYQTIAKNLGIGSKVVFLGRIDDLTLRRLYAACDLFVLPSLLEGLGLVVLEARAAGKFVIASDAGGISEVVPPGAGLLVPPGDPVRLAEAIRIGLGKKPADPLPVLRWSEAAKQLSTLYREALQCRP